MQFPTTIAAAFLALALPQAALAVASSSVTVTAFQVTLVDLDPDDGIAPGIVWHRGEEPSPYGSSTWALTEEQPTGEGDYEWTIGVGPLGPTSASAADQTTSALASVSGNATIYGTTLLAEGRTLGTLGPRSSASATADVWRTAYVADVTIPFDWNSDLQFDLSPGTAMTLTAIVSGHATVGGGHSPSAAPLDEAANIGVDLYLRVNDEFVDQLGYTQGVRTRFVPGGCTFGDCYLGSSVRFSEMLALDYRNTTADWSTGRLNMAVYAWGGSDAPASAVPEPATAVLLLAGGLVLSARARRRQA